MARLRELQADAEMPGEIFRLLTERKEGEAPTSLAKIAKAERVPKGRFVEWFTVEHEALYDAALKVVAADLALEAMQAALDATPEDVAVRKLQADVALRLASKFDRMRYGESVKIEREVRVGVDAGLLGTIGELPELARGGRAAALIEGEKALPKLTVDV